VIEMSRKPELCIGCGKPVTIAANSTRICDNPDCEIHRYNRDRVGNVYNVRRAASPKSPFRVVGTTEAQEGVLVLGHTSRTDGA